MVASQGYLKHRTFGYGHSFGLVCHYYGREAGLELREDVDTVLEPGMVVSMEVFHIFHRVEEPISPIGQSSSGDVTTNPRFPNMP